MWCKLCRRGHVVQAMERPSHEAPTRRPQAPWGGGHAEIRLFHQSHEAPTRRPLAGTRRNLG
eukprot:1750323-Pyramimonas_sp.AAC.1